MEGTVRLQKVIAWAGIASRRQAEQMIKEGRITVDGQVVRELGVKVDPVKNYIKVDGKLIKRLQANVYILLNKPREYVTTLQDPQGRPKVVDLLGGVKARVYPVGRLDYDAEGLLLLTNDGALTQKLTHPRFHVPKVYHVKVSGFPNASQLKRLSHGIKLKDGFTAPAKMKGLKKTNKNAWLEMTLFEGKNREIKRMCERIGHTVLKLKRIKFANLDLSGVKAGEYRYLTDSEVAVLKKWGTNER